MILDPNPGLIEKHLSMTIQTSKTDTATARSPLFSRIKAAEFLGVSPQTLAVWACTGRYPLKFYKIGRRAMYRLCDLEEFIQMNLVGVAA